MCTSSDPAKEHTDAWEDTACNHITDVELVSWFCALVDPWKSLTLILRWAGPKPESNLNPESINGMVMKII